MYGQSTVKFLYFLYVLSILSIKFLSVKEHTLDESRRNTGHRLGLPLLDTPQQASSAQNMHDTPGVHTSDNDAFC